MWVYWMESPIELEYNFADEILFELSWTFHPINVHNSSLVRLSLEYLYHSLFQIWSLQIDFIAIFRFERIYTAYGHRNFLSYNVGRGTFCVRVDCNSWQWSKWVRIWSSLESSSYGPCVTKLKTNTALQIRCRDRVQPHKKNPNIHQTFSTIKCMNFAF